MLKKIWMVVLGSALLASMPAQAEGELMVLPASTKLFNAHEKSIKVRNVGDAPLYLSVMVEKVTNPGLSPEKKVKLRDIPNPGMLASPDKITLGPNQARDLRLISLGEPKEEVLYRVYIMPVKSLTVEQAPADKITAPLSVSIGYGVLVRHMPAPDKQKSGWSHRCENGGITLTNTGNVRVRFSEIQVSPSGKSQPTAIGLFPGVPQVVKGKKITMNVEDKPATVSCP
ncbi:pilus assembly protein [Erwinia sorbitola]|uniref:Pilus assembly protein n=1 Tax=Erwinia sorbitola TaxID=2681984 RepID=A0A6I6EMH9_9GAMM|nr:pilus assembly protein [Erwinia sorbitola]QGU89365.1 pilus assembly protein [Erwinia sorbitola]